MPAARIAKAVVFEDSGATNLARILKDGDVANFVQSALSGIDYTVFDKKTGLQIATGALTVSAVVFDTLQTDGRWTKDSTGYNFRHTIAAAELPEGNKTYRVEYKFTPTAGEVFHVVFELDTVNLMAS